MKIEDQVCSFELAKKLKELGVTKKSYFIYANIQESGELRVIPENIAAICGVGFFLENIKFTNAYTLSELLDVIPFYLEDVDAWLRISQNEMVYIGKKPYDDYKEDYYFETYDNYSLPNTAARLLIQLIESGTVKLEDVNRDS